MNIVKLLTVKTTIMKTSYKVLTSFTDNWGSVLELVEVSVSLDREESRREDRGILKEIIWARDEVIESYTTPSHIGSPYDCTGQAFGSRFELVLKHEFEGDYSWVYKHTYSYDI